MSEEGMYGVDMGVGHNSKELMKSFVERAERLEDERANISADIRELFAEAKGTGFDTKILKEVIKRRKLEQAERDEKDALRDMYEDALKSFEGLMS